jgi:hypothetical protein
MRYNSLIDWKEFLLDDECVLPTSLIGRNYFWLMSLLCLIDWKGFLLVDEVFIPH